jgi:DNA transformation protein
MASVNEFARHIADVFSAFGPVKVRRMFAGHGLFREGLMFALIYDETLYLKVDDENLVDFISRGLPQFEYQRQGKFVGLSYYRAPESVLEDSAEAAAWSRRAWQAALRANADKPLKRRTRLPHRPRR